MQLFKYHKFEIALLSIFLLYGEAFPQAKKDTTIILISDVNMQLECSSALNDMYNFKFEKAEKQMQWFKKKYAWHPLPYFLLGLNEWWKIEPNTRVTIYDDRFLSYMDSSILVAENLHDKYPEYRIEAAFFMAAAYGFKGRLYADEERHNWGKAAAAGKTALNYLEECKEKTYLSPDLLFGDALFNYFAVWVPENYPALRPLCGFFPKATKIGSGSTQGGFLQCFLYPHGSHDMADAHLQQL